MRQLTLLGPVQVARHQRDEDNGGGTAARFRSRRTVAILGYLAGEGRAVTRETLAALIWPDEPASVGRGNLRRELHNLAQLLPGCWANNAQVAQFVPSTETTVDLAELERLVAAERWPEAAALAGGVFLEGLYLEDNAEFESWLLAARERWRGRAVLALQEATAQARRQGRYEEALSYARRLLRLSPWDEAAHGEVMRLLAWTGQREEALRQYVLCRQALADELGVEPAPETEALHQHLLADALSPPPAPPAFLRDEPGRAAAAPAPFVLRERELAWLEKHLDRAFSGQPGVVFVTGGPGRGKTALLDAFTTRALAANPGLLVARGNCTYGALGDAYAPWRDIMAELCADVETRWKAGTIRSAHARRLWEGLPVVVAALLEHGTHVLDTLVPVPGLLQRARAATADEASWLARLEGWTGTPAVRVSGVEQAGLFEQVSNVLGAVAEKWPLLLMLDDLQWIDAASSGLLFHLLRRFARRGDRVLVVCAYRPEEVLPGRGAQTQLAPMLGELKRQFGEVWLGLDWEEAEGRRFVDALLAVEPNRLGEDFRATLFGRTRGHPLFTVELLRALRERGCLVQDAAGVWQEGPHLDWEMMPARIEAVIEARIQGLDETVRQVLNVASVEGDLFTAEVTARVQHSELRALLRTLAHDLDRQHRLVREEETILVGAQAATRYRFRHALFRDYLYEQLGRGERQLLHGAVAAALEDVYAADLEKVAGQLARHYGLAGDNGRALHYYTRAAENATRIYAYDQAVALYTRALDLTQALEVSATARAELLLGRGLANAATGRFAPAATDLETALQLSRAAADTHLQWQLLIELGKLWSSRDYARALALYQEALALARPLAEPAQLAGTLNWLGNWHANAEDPAAALPYHEEALRLFEELGDRRNTAVTLDLLGIVHILRGDYARGAACDDRAIAIFRDLADERRLTSTLIARALVAAGPLLLAIVPFRPIDDCLALLDEAQELARRTGSVADEAWSAWAAALLHTVRGAFGPALAAAQRSADIAAALGHREWRVAALHARATIYNELLQPQDALPSLEEGLDLAQALQSRYWVNHLSGSLGRSYILLGDLPAARRSLAAVLPQGTPMDTAGKRYCWAVRAELALAGGDPQQALAIADQLVASAAGLTTEPIIPFLWFLKGQALAAQGRITAAAALLEDARDAALAADEAFLVWRVRAVLAALYHAAGRETAAQRELASALALVQRMAATLAEGPLRQAFTRAATARLSSPAFPQPAQ